MRTAFRVKLPEFTSGSSCAKEKNKNLGAPRTKVRHAPRGPIGNSRKCPNGAGASASARSATQQNGANQAETRFLIGALERLRIWMAAAAGANSTAKQMTRRETGRTARTLLLRPAQRRRIPRLQAQPAPPHRRRTRPCRHWPRSRSNRSQTSPAHPRSWRAP